MLEGFQPHKQSMQQLLCKTSKALAKKRSKSTNQASFIKSCPKPHAQMQKLANLPNRRKKHEQNQQHLTASPHGPADLPACNLRPNFPALVNQNRQQTSALSWTAELANGSTIPSNQPRNQAFSRIWKLKCRSRFQANPCQWQVLDRLRPPEKNGACPKQTQRRPNT